MSYYIEGKRPTLEALRQGTPLTQVLLANNLKDDAIISDIESAAAAAKIPVRRMSRDELDARSERGSHQGVMAETQPFAYADLDAVLAASADKEAALIVVCDHITDAGNLGAIIRSAEVVGAEAVVIPDKRSAQVSGVTYKTSAGAVAYLPVARVTNISKALEKCKQAGFWVAGASEKATENIWRSNLKGKTVLVMGAEDSGISQLVERNCDFLISLPQVGQTASLNVAQAACAVMYEWMRQNQ